MAGEYCPDWAEAFFHEGSLRDVPWYWGIGSDEGYGPLVSALAVAYRSVKNTVERRFRDWCRDNPEKAKNL